MPPASFWRWLPLVLAVLVALRPAAIPSDVQSLIDLVPLSAGLSSFLCARSWICWLDLTLVLQPEQAQHGCSRVRFHSLLRPTVCSCGPLGPRAAPSANSDTPTDPAYSRRDKLPEGTFMYVPIADAGEDATVCVRPARPSACRPALAF